MPALLVRETKRRGRGPAPEVLTREAVRPAARITAMATEAIAIRATSHGRSWPVWLPSLPAPGELVLVTWGVVLVVVVLEAAVAVLLDPLDPGAAAEVIGPGVVGAPGTELMAL